MRFCGGSVRVQGGPSRTKKIGTAHLSLYSAHLLLIEHLSWNQTIFNVDRALQNLFNVLFKLTPFSMYNETMPMILRRFVHWKGAVWTHTVANQMLYIDIRLYQMQHAPSIIHQLRHQDVGEKSVLASTYTCVNIVKTIASRMGSQDQIRSYHKNP